MTQNFQNWVVATPTAGDASNKIANTKFVSNATIGTTQLASGIALTTLTTIPGLSVLGNASSGVANVTTIVGSANQLLAINAAATTVLFRSVSSLLDRAVGSAQGMTLLRSATSWTSLGPGTNGQLLQTLGAGANPAWIGGMVLINTLSPGAVASTNDTSSLTSTYRNYLITFENVCPVSSAASFLMRVATAASAYTTAGYISMAQVNVSATLVTDQVTSAILLSGVSATAAVGSSTIYGVNGFVKVMNPANGTFAKMFTGLTTYMTTGTLATTGQAIVQVSGFNNVVSPITGLNFLFNSGNIATGTIRIYGLF